MNHIRSSNAYAITTFDYTDKVDYKFRDIDGKNQFKFSDY